MTDSIFISYRRADSEISAAWLSDHLKSEFGKDRVFIDFEGIPIGQNFIEKIKNTIGTCSVFLAVIGPDWMGHPATALGHRKIDDPEDYVRLELTLALEHGIPVIPVLVQGRRSVPDRTDLPPEIERAFELNGIVLETPEFKLGVKKLTIAIKNIFDEIEKKRRQQAQQAQAERQKDKGKEELSYNARSYNSRKSSPNKDLKIPRIPSGAGMPLSYIEKWNKEH